MKTDAAKNAKGPDMSKKGIKASMELSSDAINEGDELTVTVTASATGSEITGVDLYAGDELIGIQNDSLQYTWTFTPNEAGVLTIKAVVHDNEGNTKEVTKSVTICAARKAYKEHKLPGTIEIEDFDEGCDGVAFHDSDEENEGGEYRNTGVDIVEGNGGYAVGYTAKGEWLEYTVTVEYEDTYAWEMLAASGSKSSAFSIWMGNENITGEVSVPQTADNDWSVYEAIKGETSIKLPTGTYQLRLAIESPYCNLDKITFKAVSDNTDVNEAISYETTDGEYDIYTLLGIYVGKASVGKDWNDLNDKLAKGTYVLKNTKTGKTNIHIIK